MLQHCLVIILIILATSWHPQILWLLYFCLWLLYFCLCVSIIGKLSTFYYRLFQDRTNGYPSHKLVRMRPLGNATWEPQCPVGPLEWDIKTCTPYGDFLCRIPLIIDSNWAPSIIGYFRTELMATPRTNWSGCALKKCNLGASVSCGSLEIRRQNMHHSWRIPM